MVRLTPLPPMSSGIGLRDGFGLVLSQSVDRRSLLGQDRRKSKRHRAHHRTELDSLRPFSGQGQRRPALDAIARGGAHERDEVIAPAQRCKAQ